MGVGTAECGWPTEIKPATASTVSTAASTVPEMQIAVVRASDEL